MSPTVRSGLIFGLVGLIAVIVVSFVPFIGAFVCGPATALIVGGLAGYFATRWNPLPIGTGQGALAGAIAGVGLLLGTALFIIIAYNLSRNSPELQAAIDEIIRQQLEQQPNTNMRPEDMRTLLDTFVPISGFCFGVFNLVLALVGGLLGALFGKRNQSTPLDMPPAPPAVPPVG